MPLYRVVGTVTASKYLGEFEADSEEEAIEMALNSEEAYVSMCHQCSSNCEDPEIHEASAQLVE
jgi:hypothetical protein